MPEAWRWRLGVRPRGEPQDGGLITAMEQARHAADTPIDRFFFDAFGGALPDAAPYAGEAFADLRGRLSAYAPRAASDHAYWRGAPCSVLHDVVAQSLTAIALPRALRPFAANKLTHRDMGAALAARAGL